MLFVRNLPFNVTFCRHRDACVERADPPEPGALSPKTLDTDGPLVAGRLPEELLGAVAT